LQGFENAQLCMPGVIAVQVKNQNSKTKIQNLIEELLTNNSQLSTLPLIIVCDDASFTAATLNNFLWVTFTRANPSHDIYGVDEFIEHKHWGCNGPLIIDARIKPHHAPVVEKDPEIEKRIDRLFVKGASLEKLG
jgi:4-hydroxy-3-polyprenylbenzoate decarboxylase